MALSPATHQEIQNIIDNLSDKEQQELYKDMEHKLYHLKVDENKYSEEGIEILLRIECIQQDKGWWFRFKRRNALFSYYKTLPFQKSFE